MVLAMRSPCMLSDAGPRRLHSETEQQRCESPSTGQTNSCSTSQVSLLGVLRCRKQCRSAVAVLSIVHFEAACTTACWGSSVHHQHLCTHLHPEPQPACSWWQCRFATLCGLAASYALDVMSHMHCRPGLSITRFIWPVYLLRLCVVKCCQDCTGLTACCCHSCCVPAHRPLAGPFGGLCAKVPNCCHPGRGR
jgi:hypothetical protein